MLARVLDPGLGTLVNSSASATLVRLVGERGGDFGGERGSLGAVLSIGNGDPFTLP